MRKTLTNKIHNSSACGINIKSTQEYFTIKGGYNSIISKTSSYEVREKNSFIANLRDDIMDILQNKSKDLELLIWLIYLSTILEGLEGLVESLSVLIEVVEKYFLELHPIKTEYTSTQEEIIEIKMNMIHSLDLKLSPLINEYTYIDDEKNYTLISILKSSQQLINSLKYKSLLENIENVKCMFENLSSILLQYDNYKNNSNIITPNFKETIGNLNLLYEKIKTQTEITNNTTVKKTIVNVDHVNNNDNNIYNNVQQNIEYILNICKILEKHKEYKIIAYSIEFCISKISSDSIELARLIRTDDIIANFIDYVIRFKDDSVDDNSKDDRE